MTGLLEPEVIYSPKYALEVVVQVQLIKLPVSVLIIDTGVQRRKRRRGHLDATALFAEKIPYLITQTVNPFSTNKIVYF